MDISSLYNINSNAVAAAAAKASTKPQESDESFASLFQSALGNLGETNALLNKQEEEEAVEGGGARCAEGRHTRS